MKIENNGCMKTIRQYPLNQKTWWFCNVRFSISLKSASQNIHSIVDFSFKIVMEKICKVILTVLLLSMQIMNVFTSSYRFRSIKCSSSHKSVTTKCFLQPINRTTTLGNALITFLKPTENVMVILIFWQIFCLKLLRLINLLSKPSSLS